MKRHPPSRPTRESRLAAVWGGERRDVPLRAKKDEASPAANGRGSQRQTRCACLCMDQMRKGGSPPPLRPSPPACRNVSGKDEASVASPAANGRGKQRQTRCACLCMDQTRRGGSPPPLRPSPPACRNVSGKDEASPASGRGFVFISDFYLMPYFLLNLSTRPLVSTSFCLPV